MKKPDVLSMKRVRYQVIDEADEMLQPDWEEDLTSIMTGGSELSLPSVMHLSAWKRTNCETADQDEGNVQYCFFSATFPKPLRDLAKNHLAANHVRFRVGRAGSTHAK